MKWRCWFEMCEEVDAETEEEATQKIREVMGERVKAGDLCVFPIE